MTRAVLVLALVCAARVSAAQAPSSCVPPGQRVRLSLDSIGPLRTTATLAALARICQGTDTTREGFESTSPAVAFRLGSVVAVAQQHRPSVDRSNPADVWHIDSCDAQLPRGVPLCSTWRDLVRAFGDSGTGGTEFGPAIVRLKALPGFWLELNVTDEQVGSLEVQPNLSRIPPTARVTRVMISQPDSP